MVYWCTLHANTRVCFIQWQISMDIFYNMDFKYQTNFSLIIYSSLLYFFNYYMKYHVMAKLYFIFYNFLKKNNVYVYIYYG